MIAGLSLQLQMGLCDTVLGCVEKILVQSDARSLHRKLCNPNCTRSLNLNALMKWFECGLALLACAMKPVFRQEFMGRKKKIGFGLIIEATLGDLTSVLSALACFLQC